MAERRRIISNSAARSFATLATLAVLCSAGQASEILTNGGFETGDLTGWIESVGAGEGSVVTMSASGGINPNTPRSGNFLFSSSNADGASPGTPEISLQQIIDVSTENISPGTALVKASAFVSGAAAGGSFDTARISIEFFQGGAGGTPQGSVGTAPLIPVDGFYNEIQIPDTLVPSATDTIVFNYISELDPGFISIDIVADDLSLQLTTQPVPEPTSLAIWSLLSLAGAGYGWSKRKRQANTNSGHE